MLPEGGEGEGQATPYGAEQQSCLHPPRNNVVGEQGAQALGRALESNYHLRGLLLWRNRIFHSGAEALAEGLAQNGTLEWLGVRVCLFVCLCMCACMCELEP